MQRNLRMLSGSVLYLFLACHLLNMAFGLISVDAVEAARTYLTKPWATPPLAQFLGLCLLIHLVLGLAAIYRRNTLRMSGYDSVQLVSGLLVIPLLASHFVGIWAAKNLYGFDPTYRIILSYFWMDAPAEGLRQVIVVVVAWLHGSIGMFSWLRLKASWDRLSLFIYPLVVAVPVLALVGFVDAGNQVIAERQAAMEQSADNQPAQDYTQEEIEEMEAAAAQRNDEIQRNMALQSRIVWTTIIVYLVLTAATFIARAVRLYHARQRTVSVRYLHGPTFSTPVGANMLEIARLHDVPHANLCRGRGRCGTCRIRVLEADPSLPDAGKVEAATLARLKLGPDIRLACQVMPTAGELVVERLVAPDIDPAELHLEPDTSDNDNAVPETAGA
ncbi:2Fe-2S iron-sulfur cluster-binding protein [Hoeflea prorocentri]|uniref:2Fe-2S iron-sulfur cluster-binding protein n=1 Tax=Hoeflea prorocentri TaxID=1922333 RepID=A0A9X3ZH08_9HYPH|nr:2Fe-2S iron-sulfur cluster-binding protein [Hoeflea prorocentri]MCY6380295.1 2Fe-2S iron-sulfur cluster-binding protein [Hoeflea prorocentri]MDA5398095.1 2Fe-2S iron-sulfur cluster-binding protein [Hoeflea prorocentri]